MDTNTTHRPVTNDRVPSPAASSSPEEATGDSESDAEVSVEHRTTGHSPPSETDDDAESCSGRYCIVAGAADDESDDGTVDDDDVGTDEVVDMTEVDSKMALPWWRRGTVAQYAAKAADAGCRPAAAEGGKLAAEGGHAPSETNDRLFWEACIAHGY